MLQAGFRIKMKMQQQREHAQQNLGVVIVIEEWSVKNKSYLSPVNIACIITHSPYLGTTLITSAAH